jgi:L-aminopeptidase/D-esterase-like protein
VGKLFGMAHAMRGGIGTASLRVDGITVAALVAANAIGDVIDPACGEVVAGARSDDGRSLRHSTRAIAAGHLPEPLIGGATTIGIVATDAMLTKTQAGKLATMSHDGLARTIDPVHTMSDGDTMFALATGTNPRSMHLTLLGALAAQVTAAAVLNAVNQATGLPAWPSAAEWRSR